VPHAVQIKKGNVITWRGQLWRVVDAQQTFTGKHGAYYQMKLQSLADGHVETERFRSDENLEKAFIETRKMQYLYQDSHGYVFMEPQTGDQVTLGEDVLEDLLPYLAFNAELSVQLHEGKAVAAEAPASVVLEVAKTEPAVRGDTATALTKPAELETGLVLKVPGYIKAGDRVQVDTRTGQFLGRA
jgi:elongation factor P